METKNCSKCGPKSITEFSKRLSRKNGHQSICRQCQKVVKHLHYLENKSNYLARAAKRKQELKTKIDEIKSKTSCVDCGKSYPPWVMQFDHLRDKKFEISRSIALGYGLLKLMEEITKCDVVCANCHADRTHKRSHPDGATC
jgi:hypothetical protein